MHICSDIYMYIDIYIYTYIYTYMYVFWHSSLTKCSKLSATGLCPLLLVASGQSRCIWSGGCVCLHTSHEAPSPRVGSLLFLARC